MTVVTPTDRPKSVRNRCVIEVFGDVCVLSFGFRIFCCCRGFVIGLSQISFFFSWHACSNNDALSNYLVSLTTESSLFKLFGVFVLSLGC